MDEKTEIQLFNEHEAVMAFNMGLHTAVYILEKAEHLSPQARRLLLQELKRDIQTTNTQPIHPQKEVAHTTP